MWDPDVVSAPNFCQSKKEKKVEIHAMLAGPRIDYEAEDAQGGQEHKSWLFDLGMDHHTAMSFIVGLASPSCGGAWQYAVDRTNSRGEEVVVHCRRSVKKYDVESKLKTLDMVCRPKVLRDSGATHVVVAIEYGLEAFCLFSPRDNDKEAMENMLDNAQLFADCLSKDKSRLEPEENGKNCPIPLDMQCILYSDLIDNKSGPCWTSLPVAEQYEACRTIFTSEEKKLVPLKVWLYPLSNLKKIQAAIAMPEVSEVLLIRSHKFWDRFRQFAFETDSLLAELNKLEQQSTVLSTCRKSVEDFKKILNDFFTTLIKTLSEFTISVRRGIAVEEKMSSAMNLIEAVENESPFGSKYINLWIHRHGQLIDFLKKAAQLPSLHIVSDVQQLVKEIKIGDSFAVALHLSANLPAQSDCLVHELNRYTNTFSPSDSSSWTRWAKITTDAIFSNSLQFRSVGREFCNWVTDLNRETTNVRYIIFYDEKNCTAAGQLIPSFKRLYDSDSGVTFLRMFTYPKAAGQPMVEKNCRGVITLSWPADERADFSNYIVQYRSVNNEGHWITMLHPESNITMDYLQPDDSYIFRVATVTKGGKGPFGPASNEVKIDPICPSPNDLQITSVTNTIVAISWNHHYVNKEAFRMSYSVNCWPAGHQESSFIQRSTPDKEITLEPLVPDTAYCIHVRAVCEDIKSGSKLYSLVSPSLGVRTKSEAERTALVVRRSSEKLENSSPYFDVYKLPLKKQDNGTTPGVGHYVFGQPNYLTMFGKRRQRTILVLGATGSGKTTLINAMVNYMLDVKWDDDFRFKLVDETTDRSQAHSQTDLITTYELYETKGLFPSSRSGYSLTVVDTPGFGDTRGPEKDAKIVEQIQKYFKCNNGIRQLEAVCFVVQFGMARLTETQRYIFDSILSIFSSDIKENIRLMVTFADGAEPPVLEVVSKAGISLSFDPATGLPLHHKFNNSIFFANNKKDEQTNEFNRTYFNMAIEGFDNFFDDLSRIETKSLTQTREVLDERKQLEILVENLYSKTQIKLNHIEEFEQIKKKLAEIQEQKTATEDFEFEVEILVPKETDISGTGQFTTNCQKCHVTCHFPCSQADDENKRLCSAMDSSGRCVTCKCSWTDHFNQKYRYEIVMEKTIMTLEDIRKQHQAAANETLTNENLLDSIQKKIVEHEKQVEELIQETHPRIQRLNDIALRPHPISQVDYLDLVIANEKNPQNISTLQKLRKKANLKADLVRRQSFSPKSNQ